MRLSFQHEAGFNFNYKDILASMRPEENNIKGYNRTRAASKITIPPHPLQYKHEGTLMSQTPENRETREPQAIQTANSKRFKDPLLDTNYQFLSTKSKKHLFGRSYLAEHRASGNTVAIAKVKKAFLDQFHIAGGEERMLEELRDLDPSLGTLRERVEYAGAVAYVMDLKEPETYRLPDPCHVYSEPKCGETAETFGGWLSKMFGNCGQQYEQPVPEIPMIAVVNMQSSSWDKTFVAFR